MHTYIQRILIWNSFILCNQYSFLEVVQNKNFWIIHIGIEKASQRQKHSYIYSM